jgi:alkanesulfonate monooxygenase SsuD/methylene tetrahydromethanopterin reductase-like flavin-dependent oxidoreductase (luciferase family)
VNVGILLEVEEGLDWDHWRSVYAAAERLGFESVWLSDHLESPWFAGRRGLETWTALTVAVAETSRLILGPLVSPITFREPAMVARMAESLAELSGGRLVVGLGLGWNAREHAAAGIPFPPATHRKERLVQTIECIRDSVNAARVPILIGGRGRGTLDVAAKYAQEWNVTTSSPVEFQGLSMQLDALCRAAGRDPGEIRRSAAMGMLIGRDTAELRDRAERMRRCVPPLAGLESARELGWLVGTPDEIVQHLQALGEVGVQRVMLGHYDLDDHDTLQLVAETLL